MYKLVVLDIDGTLVNDERIVTERTKEIGLDKMVGYILGFNGGTCMNCETMDVLYETFIKSDRMTEIYGYAKEHNLPLMTYKNDILLIPNEITEYIELEREINNLTIEKSEDYLRDVTFDFPKALYTDECEVLDKHESAIKEMLPDLEVFRSLPFFLEVCPQDIHKATGIAKVIEILGIKQEEVIAIGDGFNDVTMIKYAGLGVAMGNAHDDIKAIADYVTTSNEEDGVCKVIEEFIL